MAKNAKTTAVDRGFAIRILEFAGVFMDMPVSEVNHTLLAEYYE